MGPDSVSALTESSSMKCVPDSFSSSSSLIPVTCEATRGTTSSVGNPVTRDIQRGNKDLSLEDSIVENGDSNELPAAKPKVSGESGDSTHQVLPAILTYENSAEDDVKVCDICGDIGYEEVLVVCSECNEGAEHIYCMQVLLEDVPEEDWFCEGCKLKHKERDEKIVLRESEAQVSKLSSSNLGSGKDGNDGNIAAKLSSSNKLKMSSEKMKAQNPAQTSEVPCKRQRDDSCGALVSKKQAVEGCNTMANASGPSLQRNRSLKVQEPIRADVCGSSQQIKSPIRPSNTRDGSFKVPEAGKSENGSMALLAYGNGIRHSFSRENSFKMAETSKVIFLPSNTVASLSSGITSRASSKATAIDGNSGAASPHSGMVNSRQFSSRRSTFQMTDSSAVTVNRADLQSSSRQAPVNSGVKSIGVSKSADALPSFLLSTRSNNSSRGHIAHRSSKEVLCGMGQLPSSAQSSGPRTPVVGNMRTSKAGICVPAGSNKNSDWKDTQTMLPRNAEMKGISRSSSGKCPVGNLIGEKSDTDANVRSSVSIAGNCMSDEDIAVVENSHLTSSLVGQNVSAVGSEATQLQTLTREKLKGSARVKENPKGLTLAEEVVKDIVLVDCSNVLESAKEDLMKPANGGPDMCAFSDGANDFILSQNVASVAGTISNVALVETTPRAVKDSSKAPADKIASNGTFRTSTLHAVSSPVADPLQSAPSLGTARCSRCKEFGHSSHICSKALSVNKDIVETTLNGCSIAMASVGLEKLNKCDAQETDRICIDKSGCSSTLYDNAIASRLASIPEPSENDSNVVGASQTITISYNACVGRNSSSSSAALQTSTSIVADTVHGNNNRIDLGSISQVVYSGTSDLCSNIWNETTTKPTTGSSVDPLILAESLAKGGLPTAISGTFDTEALVGMQRSNSMTRPSEKFSDFAVLQNQTLVPLERTNLSVNLSSLSNVGTGVPPQGAFEFPRQMLQTLPESQFLWRGSFKIIDKVSGYQVYDGIQAHPSNRASPKVYEVSRKFPSQLLLEQVERCDAWPKRFQESPPTDEDIALYIFPAEIERCKMSYVKLLEDTIKRDQAMRVYLDCAELLIFSSNQLPENSHRFEGRMYLWGVFRGGKHIPSALNAHGNDVGSSTLQVGSSVLLPRSTEDLLNKQLTCTSASGNSGGEEDMDVDMEGGREIGTTERAAPRPKSKDGPSSGLYLTGFGKTLENIHEHMSSTSYDKAIERADERASPFGINKELDFPPGFDLPPGFCRSPAMSMPEKRNMFGICPRMQERKLPPGFASAKSINELPHEKLAATLNLQGAYCPPDTGLQCLDIPPGFEPAAGKPPMSSSDHSPGFGAAAGKPMVLSSDCPPGFEPTAGKHQLPSSDCSHEHLVSKHFQGNPHHDPAPEKEMEPNSQCPAHLSSKVEGSSRDYDNRDHHYGRRGLKRSFSLASIHREVDRTGSALHMYKSKSFKEQHYFTYYNSREKEDEQKRCRSSREEKEDKRERGGNSSREKDHRERGRKHSREEEDDRKRGRNSSREKDDERERCRKSNREKEDTKKRDREYTVRVEEKRNRGREYTERENERGGDRESHRHRSRYSATKRYKDHVKHPHTLSHCHSHSQSPTQSYSPLRGKCSSHSMGNVVSRHQVNSSDTDSSDRHIRHKRLSLERDSESGGNIDIKNCLHKGKTIMDDDCHSPLKGEKFCGKGIGSKHCSLEVEQFKIIRSSETSADVDQITKDQQSFTPLYDLNDKPVSDLKISDQNCYGEISSQEPMQADASDLMNLRTDYTSNSGFADQYVMPEEGNCCAGSSSRPAILKPVTCLPLFPVEEGDRGVGEIIVNDWDFNLELGLGQQTSNKEPLSLLDQPLSRRHPCNFMFDNEAGPSGSKTVCNDSREASPLAMASILSLSMPQYRKEGNTWVEVTKDMEMSDVQNVNVKLTLSMFPED
eukprot:Gb_40677 [translate_table: standard]